MRGASSRTLGLALLTALTAFAGSGVADVPAQSADRASLGRIVIAGPAQSDPSVETLAAALSLELSQVGLMVEVEAKRTEKASSDAINLRRLMADEYKAVPGLIAVVGFDCDVDVCVIAITQPQNRSSLLIKIGIDPEQPEETARTFSSTLREAFLGPLLPEMDRIARQSRMPSPPLNETFSSADLSQTFQPTSQRHNAISPWIHLELSYQGAYMGGAASILHGPAVGLALTPRSYFALAITSGWLGIDTADGRNGSVETHRLATSLAARAIFKLGTATLVLGPILRLDSVYATFSPNARAPIQRSDLDLLGGLEVTWCLPMPVKNLGIALGASVLGSLVAHSYSIDGERISDRPPFGVGWRAGLTYGLPWPL